MHQGITPAVDGVERVIRGCADGRRMGFERGGLAEFVAMASGQIDDVIQTGGGVQRLEKLLIGGGLADKSLQGGKRHGR